MNNSVSSCRYRGPACASLSCSSTSRLLHLFDQSYHLGTAIPYTFHHTAFRSLSRHHQGASSSSAAASARRCDKSVSTIQATDGTAEMNFHSHRKVLSKSQSASRLRRSHGTHLTHWNLESYVQETIPQIVTCTPGMGETPSLLRLTLGPGFGSMSGQGNAPKVSLQRCLVRAGKRPREIISTRSKKQHVQRYPASLIPLPTTHSGGIGGRTKVLEQRHVAWYHWFHSPGSQSRIVRGRLVLYTAVQRAYSEDAARTEIGRIFWSAAIHAVRTEERSAVRAHGMQESWTKWQASKKRYVSQFVPLACSASNCTSVERGVQELSTFVPLPVPHLNLEVKFIAQPLQAQNACSGTYIQAMMPRRFLVSFAPAPARTTPCGRAGCVFCTCERPAPHLRNQTPVATQTLAKLSFGAVH